MSDTEHELLALSQVLLDSIDLRDWDTYTQLCDPTLTAFEPEGDGHLIAGMPFHQFYFEAPSPGARRQSSISRPHVRLLGDVAVVSYTRLVQVEAEPNTFATHAFEETRVWQRQPNGWQHVHFHRS